MHIHHQFRQKYQPYNKSVLKYYYPIAHRYYWLYCDNIYFVFAPKVQKYTLFSIKPKKSLVHTSVCLYLETYSSTIHFCQTSKLQYSSESVKYDQHEPVTKQKLDFYWTNFFSLLFFRKQNKTDHKIPMCNCLCLQLPTDKQEKIFFHVFSLWVFFFFVSMQFFSGCLRNTEQTLRKYNSILTFKALFSIKAKATLSSLPRIII